MIIGFSGGIAGAGVTVLLRLALGMPFWGTAPIVVVGALTGLFAYLAASLGLRVLLSLDAMRGILSGFGGAGIGICLALLVRRGLGLPA